MGARASSGTSPPVRPSGSGPGPGWPPRRGGAPTDSQTIQPHVRGVSAIHNSTLNFYPGTGNRRRRMRRRRLPVAGGPGLLARTHARTQTCCEAQIYSTGYRSMTCHSVEPTSSLNSIRSGPRRSRYTNSYSPGRTVFSRTRTLARSGPCWAALHESSERKALSAAAISATDGRGVGRRRHGHYEVPTPRGAHGAKSHGAPRAWAAHLWGIFVSLEHPACSRSLFAPLPRASLTIAHLAQSASGAARRGGGCLGGPG